MHSIPIKGGEKKVTIREARANNLVPSVTSILRVINKPMLEAWKVEQAILSALTLPKGESEDLEAFAQRIAKDALSASRQAMKIGTQVHALAEMHLLKKPFPNLIDEAVLKFWWPLRDWLEEEIKQVYCAEKVLVNRELGYAGTVDLIAHTKSFGDAILDFKTGGWTHKATFYPEYPLQLAAYRDACYLPLTNPRLVSVCVSTKEPGVQEKLWPGDNYMTGFMGAFQLWKYLNNYDPSL